MQTHVACDDARACGDRQRFYKVNRVGSNARWTGWACMRTHRGSDNFRMCKDAFDCGRSNEGVKIGRQTCRANMSALRAVKHRE